MPKGLKMTSSPIQISGRSTLTTGAADVFLSKRVDLQLNPLDNEVFVVTGVKLDFRRPIEDADTATPEAICFQRLSLSTTEQVTYSGIDKPSVLAASAINMRSNLGSPVVIIEQNAMDAPPAAMDYLQIIATNDFFINYEASGTYKDNATLTANVRVYGYRATADSSTYAALVQSELLSQ